MNNQLENNNENIDNVKIEYVNPLNVNEVLSSKNANNIEPNNITEPVMNNTSVQEPIPEVTSVPPTPPAEQNDKEVTISINKSKGKGKALIIIVVLFVLLIILASILIIPKLFNKEEEKPIVDAPPVQEVNKIGLENIIANATNSTYYKMLISSYTVNINKVDNSIIFDLNSTNEDNAINKQVVFDLNNRNLKIVFNNKEDNTDKLNALYAVLDSIGQYYGHEVDETANYLYSIQNNYNFNVNGISTSEIDPNNDTFEISINIDTDINTSGLNSIYFNLDELNLYKDNITNSTVNLKKGDQILYTNNSDIYTILIGQRKELNNNTYNTISSIIELLYPNEVEDFKSKFTMLSTISFDKYKITVDPILDENTYPQYKDNYKFILIEIQKQV